MNAKIAVPLAGGRLSMHFGHAEQFAVVTIQDNEIVREEILTPPEHQPGAYPRFLASRGVTDIIVGGIGPRAVEIFEANGVKVNMGAPKKSLRELSLDFINGSLLTGDNSCDHDDDHHDHHHDHHHGFHYN